MTASPQLWGARLRIEEMLADGGVHRSSDVWLADEKRFYLHETALDWTASVGRGGAKNFELGKMAITEMVGTPWKVGVGERHWYVGVSNRLDEVRKDVGQLSEWLTICGFQNNRSDDRIELKDIPVGFFALPCTTKAVRGPRAIGGYLNELATWSNDGVNPSEDVAASIAAMMITHADARTKFFSSPMGTEGFFAKLLAANETEHQIVTHHASWEANPGGITREQAWKAAKGDQRTFDREYRAIPQASVSAAFTEDEISQVVRPPDPPSAGVGVPVVVLDASGGAGDSMVWAAATWIDEAKDERTHLTREIRNDKGEVIIRDALVYDANGQPVRNPAHGKSRRSLLVTAMTALEGKFARERRADDVVNEIAAFARRNNATRVFADQYAGYAFAGLFAACGLSFTTLPWTNETKTAAVARLRALARQRSIVVPPSDEAQKLVSELRQFRERILPSGAISFGARSGGHDDRVAVLLTAMMADSEGHMRGSPFVRGSARTDYGDFEFSFA